MARHRRIYLRLAAVLVACRIAASQPSPTPSPNPYLELPKDHDVSKLAKDKTAEYCGEGFKGAEDLADTREARKEVLEQRAGGDNIIKKVLTEAKSPEELSEKAQEEADPVTLLFQTFPIILLILMCLTYWICCWTACCKCCRCGAKERPTPIWCKLIIAVIVFGMFLGMLICGIQASIGYQQTVDGFDNMQCTSSKLLEQTLNGESKNNFIGMLPLLGIFNDMDKLLDPGSRFMTDVNDVLDDTVVVDKAVKVTTWTLDLLTSMMEISNNANPGGATKLHKCEFCNKVAPLVAPVSTAVSDGVATALAKAREEVETQLTGQGGEQLSSTLQTAAEPVKEMKNMIRDTFESFVDDSGLFPTASKGIKSAFFQGAVAFIIVYGILVACCSACGQGAFILCEGADLTKKIAPGVANRLERLEDGGDSGGGTSTGPAPAKNPYGRTVPRCTCCSWCCGFPLTWLALLVGGLFLMLTLPLSGTCLVLDEINGDTLKDIMGALGMNMSASGDSVDMTVSLIDNCFAVRGSNANLLDIIYITNETGGKPSLKEEIVEKTKDMITQQFDDVTDKLASKQSTLSGDSDVISLRELFRDTDIDGLIIPTSAMRDDARFANVAASTDVEYAKFSATSLKCSDYDVSAVHSAFQDSPEVPGLNTVTSRLSQQGDGSTSPDLTKPCNKRVNCAGNPICQDLQTWYGIKEELMENTVYRCDVFELPSGAECDPKDMQYNSVSQTWFPDCYGDGTLRIKEKTCNLVTFKQYMQDYNRRLEKIFDRLDKAVQSSQTKITDTLKQLIYRDVITPIDRIADGATCGFLSVIYRELVDGLCYQGVYGLAWIAQMYVAVAILTIILLIFTYAVWRRSIDNRTSWKAEIDTH